MTSAASRIVDNEAPVVALLNVGRACFGVASLVGAVALVLVAALPRDLPSSVHLGLVAGLAAFAIAAGVAWLRSARRSFPVRLVHIVLSICAMSLAGVVGVALGDGVRNPALGICAVLICIVGAILGWRVGLSLTLYAFAEAGVLAWLESHRLSGAPTGLGRVPLMLGLQWLVLISAFVSGALISQIVARYLAAAANRERYIGALLRIAADWHWEQDRDFRYTVVSGAGVDLDPDAARHRIGLAPWEEPGIDIGDSKLDEHRADLDAHRPFSGLLVRRRDRDGKTRVHSLSGEPKYTADGAFSGYWGVARDVTEEFRAQRGLEASETRYRELFERSPSPLFLSRRGVIFDANVAAARLFGFGEPDAMNGVHVRDLYTPGEHQRRMAERVERLERMAVGEGVPVSDFVAFAADGRAISVQSTAVRVDTVEGPATLSILFDITARKAAEAALRRSEAMLAHLFATSPDCITLSEISSGRHTLVNAAFTRVTGYSAEQTVGRTATEIGLWHDLSDRDRLIDAVARLGVCTDLPASIRTRSGGVVSMLLSAARFEMDQRSYMVINARDITQTERTRLEHAAILERASIGIAFTRDRRFVEANPRFERIFGWPLGTLRGQPGSVVWIDDADYAEASRLAAPLLSQGKPFEIEREMSCRDGSRFWCRLLAQVVDPQHPVEGGTIWIADDVTERRRLDQALASARDAAEAASRAKSAFLANTSHEIRTPLNGLLGLARMALQDGLDDRVRQGYVRQIFDSAQGLEGILSDILDLSKIEAGKITFERVAFDLHDMLAAVQLSYRSLAEVKGLALELSIDPALPRSAEGDPVRVRQILSNFITNAIKFTEHGRVRIEASATTAGHARLAVVDSGAGIDASMLGQLWKPFSQGDSSTTRRYGGTGLGLSICRELAELMGGSVGMDSSVGRGSTFWAELPLGADAPVGDSGADDADDDTAAGGDGGLLRGRRVLLVEDNPVNMLIAVATLERWGIEVAQARNGRVAIDAVQAAVVVGRPFDAVLMDVQMPVMSGHEAALELRRQFDAQALPIIALTAAALASERDLALASGMNEFLTKPIDAPKLRQALARVVRESVARGRST